MRTERPIYLSELLIFLRKKQNQILQVSLICFLAAFVLTLLLSTPQFRADATFKQARTNSEEANSLQTLLLNMRPNSEETSAISIMHSRSLLTKVIERTALQIVPIQSHKFSELLLKKKFPKAQFRQLYFERETPFFFTIHPTSSTTFDLFDQSKKLLARGTLNKPLLLDFCHFTLTKLPPRASAYQIVPKRKALRDLTKRLKIKPTRVDPNILQLNFSHPNRETAIALLDTLMEEFQLHLQQEHEQLAMQQLDYLQKRKDQLGYDYTQTLDHHTAYLKNQGSLNLAEELETLSEPKEQYTCKRHQLDLEMKKWNEPKLLASLEPLPNASEFTGLTLETAEKLHQSYAEEHEQQIAQIASLETYSDKLGDDHFEISTLSHVLTDEVSQKIVQKAADIALKLADQFNYSEKEILRLKEALATQKQFLQEHLLKKIDLLHLQQDLTEQKMGHLKQIALDLIRKEKEHVEEKLTEINAQMETLPEKWRLENELKFKKELMMQIIEGVTQLSESKVVNHHLFHIASKPLDPADAPPTHQSAHFFLYSAIGGLLGAFLFTIGSFLRAVTFGLPISADYLRDHKIPFTARADLRRLINFIEPHPIIVFINFGSAKSVATQLAQTGKRSLRVVQGLQEQIHALEDHHLAVVQHLSAAKLHAWKRDYDHILVEIESIEAAAAYRSAVDQIVIKSDETKPEELVPFDESKLLILL